jgi:hypothetical protein
MYLENGKPCGNALSRIIKMMLDKNSGGCGIDIPAKKYGGMK